MSPKSGSATTQTLTSSEARGWVFSAALGWRHAAKDGQDYVMALRDLAKAFDRIPHAHLMMHARELGF